MDKNKLNVQAQSIGKYIQDVWIIALLLVIFHHETTFELPFYGSYFKLS